MLKGLSTPKGATLRPIRLVRLFPERPGLYTHGRLEDTAGRDAGTVRTGDGRRYGAAKRSHDSQGRHPPNHQTRPPVP